MPDLRDFLSRFRPVGTPGAAGRRGVPADRITEREAELRPVLALLAETEQDATRIRQAAAEQAEQRRREAHQQAEAILADARLRADAVRAAAAARVTGTAADEQARTAAAAEQRVARLRALIDERMPGHVERAVAQALTLLAEPSPNPATPGSGSVPGSAPSPG